MSKHLSHELQSLQNSILEGKLPRNLKWNEAVALVEHLGKVEAHGQDEFAFVVGSQRAFFKRPHTDDLDIEEVSRLRKFLKDAGTDAPPSAAGQPCRMIVVIDHHAAHIYQDVNGSLPQGEVSVKPLDPLGFHHHLIHRKEAHYSGDRAPEESSFYEAVAKDLVPADEIVLIGHGTGKSSAVDFLADYLKKHHSGVSEKVIATETADLSALTEPEIEAIAKRHRIALV